MNNVKSFNTFQTSFKRLKEKSFNNLLKINVECYHHDFPNEPFLHVEADVNRIFMEHVEDHGLIISIVTEETIFSFTEKNYYTNLSNDAVVFSSKNDDETYYIIEFI